MTTPASEPPDGTRESRAYLFVDLRGFTEHVDRRGATDAVTLLTRYREAVRAVVARHAGSEVRTEGDSFYLTFRLASDALVAALELQRSLGDSSAGPAIAAGIGIHAGETVPFDGAYVGSAVNISARVCGVARAGEIVTTATVRELTRSVVDAHWERMGDRALKGVDERIALYRVSDRGTTAGRRAAERRGLRRPAPALGPRVVAAVVALVAVLALAASMIVGKGPNAVSPDASGDRAGASSSVGTPRGSADDRVTALRSRLPPSIAGGCAERPVSGAGEAALTCAVPGQSEPSEFEIDWFYGQPGAADERIRDDATKRHVADGDCGRVDAAIGQWKNGTESQGWLLCFRDSVHQAWIEWTYSRYGIEVAAFARDNASEALFGWWRQTAPILVASAAPTPSDG